MYSSTSWICGSDDMAGLVDDTVQSGDAETDELFHTVSPLILPPWRTDWPDEQFDPPRKLFRFSHTSLFDEHTKCENMMSVIVQRFLLETLRD